MLGDGISGAQDLRERLRRLIPLLQEATQAGQGYVEAHHEGRCAVRGCAPQGACGLTRPL